eukprot:TRINITY_DN262_c0_g1_i1.p1 TRINITY_DN262_c0_g1~~TRINITY_DN262_c0_g1_i1.p1  ORF type:complete len:273 (+),score=49.81 TRINITY_DN262_c0_g1_i1:39-857(+)
MLEPSLGRQASWDDVVIDSAMILNRTLASRSFDSLTILQSADHLRPGSASNLNTSMHHSGDDIVQLYNSSNRGSLFGSTPRISSHHQQQQQQQQQPFVGNASPRITNVSRYASPRISLLYSNAAPLKTSNEISIRMSGDIAVPEFAVTTANCESSQSEAMVLDDDMYSSTLPEEEPSTFMEAPRYAVVEPPRSKSPTSSSRKPRFDDNCYQDPEDELEENLALMEQQLVEIKQMKEMMEKTQAKFLREQEILMCRMSVANFLSHIKPASPNQ